MIRLEPIQHEGVKGPKFDRAKVSIIYNGDTDELNLNFDLMTKDRDYRQNLCSSAMNYIKEALKAIMDPVDPFSISFVGSAFMPYTIKRKDKYNEDEIRRGRYMDSITYIDIVVRTDDNPHEFTQCQSELTEDDMTTREYPSAN